MSEWPPDVGDREAQDLDRVSQMLSEARPAPVPGFSEELGQAVELEAGRRRIRPRPPQLWVIASALVLGGATLLAVAAAQL